MSMVPFRRSPRFNMSSIVRYAQNPNQRRRAASFLGQRLGRRTRFARGRAQTATMQRRVQYRSGILGGTNADQRMIYRRKSMPRRKRKRWTNFVRKVDAAGEKSLGAQTVLFNDVINQTSTTTGTSTQNALTLALYPFLNSTAGWLNDLAQIGTLENGTNPTAAAGTTVSGSSKLLFQSAILDVTIRNVSTQAQLIGEGPNPVLTDVQVGEAALELDIYTMNVRKLLTDVGARYASISQVLNAYDDPEIGGAGTGLVIGDRGASPFEFGAQMGRFGIKIIKKQKFFIPNGQTVTFQTRDPKRHVIHYDQLIQNEGFIRPGWTQVYYFIYKLVPGLSQGTTVGTYRAKLALGVTKKYMYKVEGRTEQRERYLGATYTPGPVS